MTLDEYRFASKQLSYFSEIACAHRHYKNVLIAGLNFYTDDFVEDVLAAQADTREERYRTVGAFANYVFDAGQKVAIENGLRVDCVANEKLYVLPRLSALFKWTGKLTSRIGGGMGYRNVAAIDRAVTQGEQSYGVNIDVGYKTSLGDKLFLIIHQMFFYTRLEKPLVLQPDGGGFAFANINGFMQSYGAKTFFKIGFYDFVWFVGYTTIWLPRNAFLARIAP